MLQQAIGSLRKKTAAGARLYKRFTIFGQLRVVAVVGVLVVNSATASEHRSSAVTREFQRKRPCPSTGRTSGA
jgi:hypothetical protein